LGILISVINGVRTFGRIMKGIMSLIKKAARTGKNIAHIIAKPGIIIKMLLQSFLSAIKTYAIIAIVVTLIVVLTVSLVVEGVKIVYEKVKDAISDAWGAVTGWMFGEKAKEEVNNIPQEQIDMLIEAGSPYHPQNMPKYIEVEQNTTPVETTIKDGHKYKKEVWVEGNDTDIVEEEYDYKLDLIDVSYQYRLPWEFVLALDVVNDTALKTDYFSKKIVMEAENRLAPIYTWGYDKYSKDITEWDQTWEIMYKDGKKLYEKKVKEVKIYNSYPLALLDKVETIFKDYDFVINENQISDTGWYTGNISTYSWTEKEGTGKYKTVFDGYDENGNPIMQQKEIMKTVYYSVTTYHKYRTKVVKDIVGRVMDTVTGDRLNKFLKDFGLADTKHNEDMSIIYEMVKRFDNTEQLQIDIEDYMASEFISDSSSITIDPMDIEIKPTELLAEVPYFSQRDSRWRNAPYGNSTVRRAGCGPTSMAMVAASLGGYNASIDLNNDSILDPYEMCTWSYKNGYKADYGTHWSFFESIGNKLGLDVEQKSVREWKEVLDALEDGKLVISSMKPGHFTSSGHFIVLAGVSSEGKIIVNDPNSKSRSERTWDWTTIILPEAKQFWIIDK